jgi:hypothetical protein
MLYLDERRFLVLEIGRGWISAEGSLDLERMLGSLADFSGRCVLVWEKMRLLCFECMLAFEMRNF